MTGMETNGNGGEIKEMGKVRRSDGKISKSGKRYGTSSAEDKNIRVDSDTWLVIKQMQLDLESWGLRATMCESLKILLAHRQPGGWGDMVEKAKRYKIIREIDEKLDKKPEE